MYNKEGLINETSDNFAAMGSNMPIIPTSSGGGNTTNIVKSSPFPLSMWKYEKNMNVLADDKRPYFGLTYQTPTGRKYLLAEGAEGITSLYLEMNDKADIGERQLTFLHKLEKSFWELSDKEVVQAILVHDDLDLDEYCLLLEYYNHHEGCIEHLVTPFSIVAKGVTLSGLADMLGEDVHQTQIRFSIPGKVFEQNDPLLKNILSFNAENESSCKEKYSEVHSIRILSVDEMTPELMHLIKENNTATTHIRGVLGGNPRHIPRNVLCVFRVEDGVTLLRLSRENMEQLMHEVYQKEYGKIQQQEKQSSLFAPK